MAQELPILTNNKYFSLDKCSMEFKSVNFLALQAFFKLMEASGNVNVLPEKEKMILVNGVIPRELTNAKELAKATILIEKLQKLAQGLQTGGSDSLKICKSSPLNIAIKSFFSSSQWNNDKEYLTSCYTSYLSDQNAPLGFDLAKAIDSVIDGKGQVKEQPKFDNDLSLAAQSMAGVMKVADQNACNAEIENE